jgi:hypothetical protein
MMRDFDKVFLTYAWNDDLPSGIQHTPESSLPPGIAARKARQAELWAAEKADDIRSQAENQDPDDSAGND